MIFIILLAVCPCLMAVMLWWSEKDKKDKIENMKYKVGDKVMIVSCEMNPQYVGKIGKVESVLGTDDNALIKVSCKGKMIPDYATEDCLKRIDD